MSIRNRARETADQIADTTTDTAKEVAKGHGVINRLSRAGVRSEYAYIGAFASIGLSFAAYFISRGKKDDSKAQADRWGIFVGHWAPTFMALGVALKLEEDC